MRWVIAIMLGAYLGCAARLPRGTFNPTDAESNRKLAQELGVEVAYLYHDAKGRFVIRYFGSVKKDERGLYCVVDLKNEVKFFKIKRPADCYWEEELQSVPLTR